MDRIIIDIDPGDATKAMALLKLATGASVKDAVTMMAKSGMREVMNYTPPGGRGIRLGSKAKKALEARIVADFAGIMAPVKLKRKRKEKHPDVEAVLARQPMQKRGGKFRRKPLFPKAYVSQAKFNKALATHKARVGHTASGWMAAMLKLNIPSLKWVSRHGTVLGGITTTDTPDNHIIEAHNNSPYISQAQQMALLRLAESAGTKNIANYAARILNARMKKAGIAS